MHNPEDMIKAFWLGLLAKLQKQDLAFLLLAAGIWYFHTENSKLEAKIDQCNNNLIQIYQSHHEQFIEVLQEITLT